MRLPIWIIVLAALVGFGAVFIAGQALLQPDVPLILSAGFADERITPNADGDNDITRFDYEISRMADVSLVLEDESGRTFTFRDAERRIPETYSVLFSGVVDGYTNSDETISGTVERRLMPPGTYTWRLQAIAVEGDETQEATGQITLADADVPLPVIETFTISPPVFTPNQDGIDDRVQINLYLEQPENELEFVRVFLVDDNGNELPISARAEGQANGENQRIRYDYEGGIDLNADPPPDGTYTVVALAQDRVGQRVRREGELTLLQGGKPFAEIVPQAVGVDVVFEVQSYEDRFYSTLDKLGDPVTPSDNPADLALTAITMPVGDLLVFRLTIENYSDVPLRTTGPPPGTVYQQDQRAASLGAFESPGVWRVGLDCETAMSDYPYRWAIGTDEVLVTETDPNTGEVFKYLPPGTQTQVWGAIRMTELEERNNPQQCWAGLIHEDVAVVDNRVGPREIELFDLGSTAD